MPQLKISINQKVFIADLYDTPTANAIVTSLPIESPISTWGEEIYCQVDVSAPLEKDAKAVVEPGDLAYWPAMPTFCIFFGPTPMSTDSKPVAAAPVNVFGKLKDFDIKELQSVNENDIIKVEVIER